MKVIAVQLSDKERAEIAEATYERIAQLAKLMEIAADKRCQLEIVSTALHVIKLVGHLEQIGEV